MIVDFKDFRPPYFYNPKKITLIEKFMLMFKRKRKAINEEKSYLITTYYKKLKDKIYVISMEYERK